MILLAQNVSHISYVCSFEEFALVKKNFKWLPSWLNFFKKNNKTFVNISTRKITVLKKKWTILRSPAQDKKSREQFGCFSTKTAIVISFRANTQLAFSAKNIVEFQYFFFVFACFFINFQINKLPLHTAVVSKIVLKML